MSNMPILIILVLMLGTMLFGAYFWIGLGILAVTAWLAFVAFGASLDSMFDTPDGTEDKKDG